MCIRATARARARARANEMCILDVLLINTCQQYFILKLFRILEFLFIN